MKAKRTQEKTIKRVKKKTICAPGGEFSAREIIKKVGKKNVEKAKNNGHESQICKRDKNRKRAKIQLLAHFLA